MTLYNVDYGNYVLVLFILPEESESGFVVAQLGFRMTITSLAQQLDNDC